MTWTFTHPQLKMLSREIQLSFTTSPELKRAKQLDRNHQGVEKQAKIDGLFTEALTRTDLCLVNQCASPPR
jgi:hypothetical protein